MFALMTTGGGTCFAFPDVCKTPTPAGPVPIPYPNIAFCRDGKGAKHVWVKGKSVLRKGDKIRMSTGDEAGTAGGIISNKTKGKATVAAGSGSVLVEGRRVAHHAVRTTQNGSSGANQPATGVQAGPSQSDKKIVYGILLHHHPFESIKGFIRDCAPSLQDDIDALKKQNVGAVWDNTIGKDTAGSWDPHKNKIRLSAKNLGSVTHMALTIAHEGTHARRKASVSMVNAPTADRYVSWNTKMALKEEGEAGLREARLYEEILKLCGEKGKLPDDERMGEAFSHARKALQDPNLRTDKARIQNIADNCAQGYTSGYAKAAEGIAKKIDFGKLKYSLGPDRIR